VIRTEASALNAKNLQKSEFRKSLNRFNAGERMNIESRHGGKRPTSNFEFEKMKSRNNLVMEWIPTGKPVVFCEGG